MKSFFFICQIIKHIYICAILRIYQLSNNQKIAIAICISLLNSISPPHYPPYTTNLLSSLIELSLSLRYFQYLFPPVYLYPTVISLSLSTVASLHLSLYHCGTTNTTLVLLSLALLLSEASWATGGGVLPVSHFLVALNRDLCKVLRFDNCVASVMFCYDQVW